MTAQTLAEAILTAYLASDYNQSKVTPSTRDDLAEGHVEYATLYADTALAWIAARMDDADLIGRLAQAAFYSDDIGGHHKPGPFVYSPHTWESIPEAGRENYRRLMRDVLATLTDALGVRQ